jgi:hypothetical protein
LSRPQCFGHHLAGAVERSVEICLVDCQKLLERSKEPIPIRATRRYAMTVSHLSSVLVPRARWTFAAVNARSMTTRSPA